MDNKRLLWLAVNASHAHSSLALPLAQLAAKDSAGWSWHAIAAVLADDAGELAVRVNAEEPALLSATLYLFNRRLALDVLQRVKVLRPQCRIAVGGPECSGQGAAELLARYPQIDFALDGEAEAALPRMLDLLHAGDDDFQGIVGLTWRNAAGRIISNGGRALYDAWGTAPAPITSSFFDHSKPFVQMETARGCQQGCSFCTSCHTAVRYKSLDAVRSELTQLREHKVREVRLLDRTFNTPPGRCISLLRLFREHFADMRFHLEIHPQLLSPAIRDELRQARPGQLHIEAGIQTLNPAVLRKVGRLDQPERALDGLTFLCQCPSFDTHADLLAGLPEQSYRDVLHDVAQLVAIGPAEIQLEVLKVLHGTPLREQADAIGLRFSPETPYDVIATDTMSAQELHHCRKLSRLLDITYNHPALQDAFRAAARTPDAITDMLAFMERQGLSLGPAPSLKKRFALLSTFLHEQPADEARQRAQDALAYNWLLWAFPPGDGPAKNTQPANELPEDAQCVYGDHTCRPQAGRRLWLLSTSTHNYWFIYDRAIAPNRAAAVFRKDTNTCPPAVHTVHGNLREQQ
ncbi:MAG: DUF4080 domain-containing protein [Lentisphaerae bacterium]|nr:DUF4080 domain-containing protein [Lentisphaerota bacterium]